MFVSDRFLCKIKFTWHLPYALVKYMFWGEFIILLLLECLNKLNRRERIKLASRLLYFSMDWSRAGEWNSPPTQLTVEWSRGTCFVKSSFVTIAAMCLPQNSYNSVVSTRTSSKRKQCVWCKSSNLNTPKLSIVLSCFFFNTLCRRWWLHRCCEYNLIRDTLVLYYGLKQDSIPPYRLIAM